MPPRAVKQCGETKEYLSERLFAEAYAQRCLTNEARYAAVQQLLAWAFSNGLGSCNQVPSLSKQAKKRKRRRKRKAATANARATEPKINATKPIPPKTKEQSPNLPSLADMLQDLAVQFRTEICSLQIRFNSELQDNSKSTLGNQIIVADITFDKRPIEKGALKSMRSTIVSTIENYEESNKSIPIFYSMINNDTKISILCEDEYAFECLKDCVMQMKSLGNVCLSILEPNASRLYCMSVIYTGLINDPMKFLLHLHLQHPKIRTEYWIVASSNVITGRHETQFLFLVDELSVLALEHQYHNKLFICLEEALFHNHGQLPNFF